MTPGELLHLPNRRVESSRDAPGLQPRMPTFVIIGAGKGGTTSLYHYLAQHPDVFMSTPKEAKFFAYEGEKVNFKGPKDKEKNEGLITTLAGYQALFRGAVSQKAVGEASPHYLYVPKACERIYHHIPDATLFAILRDPSERAYKSFLHLVRDGREPFPRDFSRALADEPRRLREGYAPIWAYQAMGFYHAQLTRYVERFRREQLHVYLYEDLKADPAGLARRMFRALGIDDSFVPDTTIRYNMSFVPRSRLLYNVLQKSTGFTRVVGSLPGGWRAVSALQRVNQMRPDCPQAVRRALIAVFRDDILRTQDLIRRDLSSWLEEEPRRIAWIQRGMSEGRHRP